MAHHVDQAFRRLKRRWKSDVAQGLTRRGTASRVRMLLPILQLWEQKWSIEIFSYEIMECSAMSEGKTRKGGLEWKKAIISTTAMKGNECVGSDKKTSLPWFTIKKVSSIERPPVTVHSGFEQISIHHCNTERLQPFSARRDHGNHHKSYPSFPPSHFYGI